MEHDLEKLAVTALPISASPIMRHDFCIESCVGGQRDTQ